jgi:hypothetical protein
MYFDSDTIKKSLPYVTGFMIFCGFVKLKLYYAAFHIDIQEYLELTEILSSFVSDIILYSVMILFGYFFSFLLTTKERTNQQVDIADDILKTDGFFKRLGKHIKNLKQIIFIIFALGLINLTALFVRGETHLYGTFSLYSLFVIFVFVILREEYRRKYISHFNMDINHSFFNILLTAVLFMSFTIKYSFSDIDATKNQKKYIGTIIQTKDNQRIISDSVNYYVGMTRNYLFIYNQLKDETIVLNRSDVKDITLK